MHWSVGFSWTVKSRGGVLKSAPEQRIGLRFMLHLYPATNAGVHNLFGPRAAVCDFSELEGRRQNYELILRGTSIKYPISYLSSIFIACGLILLQSELFRIIISSKIVNTSIKFEFTTKIF